MGISFSKSVKVGAVRFNFSGAGIGVSVGIPGLRIGTGPRGAYIAGGASGFRYRKSLGTKRMPPVERNGRPIQVLPAGTTRTVPENPEPNIVATVVHETKNVMELGDSSSDSLLQSMNEQRQKGPLWPFVAAALGILFALAIGISSTWPAEARLAIFLAFVGVVVWTLWRDKMRRLTVLFFEPDAQSAHLFESLASALRTAASAKKIKSVASTSQYADTKYSAGASQGLQFSTAALSLGQAPGVVANVDVPILKSGRTILAFYPDRVLAFQGKSVAGIEYRNLTAQSHAVKYVESEALPVDALVVDRTWAYVNKKGGPDRRFKDNRELPVCLYNQFNLSTIEGLDVRFLGSKESGFEPLSKAILALQ